MSEDWQDVPQQEYTRGVAEGIARERAAVVAWMRKWSGEHDAGAFDIEAGDHHPDHADALARRDREAAARALEEAAQWIESEYGGTDPNRLRLRADRIRKGLT